MTAYYNDNDKFSAAWLHALIRCGEIAPGHVDTRSILDVQASDLKGYTQVHFFAGIGGWSRAARLVSWPDDRPLWTGSCPCQPFSAAGRQQGEADKRHLWPEFLRLIAECNPPVVFGEQVASRLGREWLAGVRADLEALAYAVGAADLCAASAGAPHIRQRLWWVADHQVERCGQGCEDTGRCSEGSVATQERSRLAERGQSGGLADADRAGSDRSQQYLARPRSRHSAHGEAIGQSEIGDADDTRLQERERDGRVQRETMGAQPGQAAVSRGDAGGMADDADHRRQHAAGQGNGKQPATGAAVATGIGGGGVRAGSSFWDAYDLVHCTDGKARRFEPGSFPLAHGVSSRVGRLRGYGNAIVPQVAAQFIQAWMTRGD